MEFQDIKVEVKAGIGIISLNRPERRNAITIKMRREISLCLTEWENSPEVGVVVITGSDKAFSAGFELSDFNQPELFAELLDSSSRYHRDVWSFAKPIIGAINGAAMGGGFDLATLCDIRICSETANFGHPEIKFGGPPIITPLRWIIGEGLARDLCLTGRRINAAEAHRIGLVSEVVPAEHLLERAIQIGQTILEAPLDTILFTKQYFVANSGKSFEEAFYIEHDQAFQKVLLVKARAGFANVPAKGKN